MPVILTMESARRGVCSRPGRTGSEGRISSLKRGYGWDRTRLDGTEGARIWTDRTRGLRPQLGQDRGPGQLTPAFQ